MKRVVLMTALIGITSIAAMAQYYVPRVIFFGRLAIAGSAQAWNEQYARIERETGNSLAAYSSAENAVQEDAAERLSLALDQLRAVNPDRFDAIMLAQGIGFQVYRMNPPRVPSPELPAPLEEVMLPPPAPKR